MILVSLIHLCPPFTLFEGGGSTPASSAGRFTLRFVGTETFVSFDVSEPV